MTEKEAVELALKVRVLDRGGGISAQVALPGVVLAGERRYIVRSDGHGLVAVRFDEGENPPQTKEHPFANQISAWLATINSSQGERDIVGASPFCDWLREPQQECPTCGGKEYLPATPSSWTAGWIKGQQFNRSLLARFVCPLESATIGGFLSISRNNLWKHSEHGVLVVERPGVWLCLFMPLRTFPNVTASFGKDAMPPEEACGS